MKVFAHFEQSSRELVNLVAQDFDDIIEKLPDVSGIPIYVRADSNPPDVWPRAEAGVTIAAEENAPR